MGTVVKLDSSTRGRGKAGRSSRRESRTALVLGGGGFTGGVYQIGALRALDLLSVNRSVNQFDIYVGTSAGSLIAVAGRQRRHARADDARRQRPDADAASATQPATCCCGRTTREFATQGAPAAAARARRRARRSAASCGSLSAVDLVLALADALPSGIYTGAGRRGLRAQGALATRTAPTTSGCSSASSTSPRPTWTPASGSCSAPRAGTTSRSRAAVRASTALPMVYKPVPGQAGASWSTAASSPPPTSTSPSRRARSSSSSSTRSCRSSTTSPRRSRRCSARASAASRTWASRRSATRRSSCSPTSACTRWPRHWKERYPGVDIVLIEPDPDDELMFQTNILNYASRRRRRPPRLPVGHASSWPRTTTRCARSAAATASRSPPRGCARSSATSPPRSEKTRAWRRILEQTTGALLRQSARSGGHSGRYRVERVEVRRRTAR